MKNVNTISNKITGFEKSLGMGKMERNKTNRAILSGATTAVVTVAANAAVDLVKFTAVTTGKGIVKTANFVGKKAGEAKNNIEAKKAAKAAAKAAAAEAEAEEEDFLEVDAEEEEEAVEVKAEEVKAEPKKASKKSAK